MTPDATTKLHALWRAVLDRLLSMFNDGSTIRASHLAVAVAFLKDNGISARTMHAAKAGLEALDRMFDA